MNGSVQRWARHPVRTLVGKYNIDPKRGRVFYKVAVGDPDDPKGVEYWYLP